MSDEWGIEAAWRDRGPAAGTESDCTGLWPRVERMAREMGAREPFLRRILDERVLSHETAAQIVGAGISRALAQGTGHDADAQALVTHMLEDDADLLRAAEADLAAIAARDPACRSMLHALLYFKGFHALQAHRVAHRLWRCGRRDLAFWLSSQASVRLGVDIHPAVVVGRGVVLDHATGIVIGETALVEDDVSILQGVTLGATGKQRGDRHPKVRRGAMLGAGAQILGNIEIGRMSRVGAGSVVLHAVPARCTVAGVPARVVRQSVREGFETVHSAPRREPASVQVQPCARAA